jgi:hypothetical protein
MEELVRTLIAPLVIGSCLALSSGTSRADVLDSFSCGNRQAIVLEYGITKLQARGSGNCNTNHPRMKVCIRVQPLRAGRVVAQQAACRNGAGPVAVSTPIVARTGAISIYRAAASYYVP